MATIANLVVNLQADTSELRRNMDQVIEKLNNLDKNIGNTQSNLEKTGVRLGQLGSSLRSLGTGLTAAVTVPIIGVGTAAIKMAMDAVESENLFRVSFGDMADAAHEWSVETSQALGLNQYELRRTSATLFTMFDSMGIAKKGAFEMSTSMTTLAYDMASFFDLRPEEAFEKLRAGIVGEAEPLKRLGILVDETTTKHYAYTHGIAKNGAELSQQQKVLARYGSILEQTSKAQGDLARTIDSPTNTLRVMREKASETAIALGMELLPFAERAIGIIASLGQSLQGAVRWFSSLSEPAKTAGVVIALAAAAVGPLLIALGTLAGAISNLIRLWTSYAAVTTRATAATAVAGTTATTTAASMTGLGAALAKVGSFAHVLSGLVIPLSLVVAARGLREELEKLPDAERLRQKAMTQGGSGLWTEALRNQKKELTEVAGITEDYDSQLQALAVHLAKNAKNENDLSQAMREAIEAAQAKVALTKEQIKEQERFEAQQRAGINLVEEMRIGEAATLQERAKELKEYFKRMTVSQAEFDASLLAAKDQHAMVYLQRELELYQLQQEAARENWRTISEINNELGLKQMQKDLAKMRGVFGGFFAGLSESFKSLWQGMSGGGGMSGLFKNLGDSLMQGFGNLLSGGITSLINAGISALAGLGKKLWHAITGGPSEAELAGREAAAKFRAGLEAGLTAAQQAAALSAAASGANLQWAQSVIAITAALEDEALALQLVDELWRAEREGAEAVAEVTARITALIEEHKKAVEEAAEAAKKAAGEIAGLTDDLEILRQKLDAAEIVGKLRKAFEDFGKTGKANVSQIITWVQQLEKALGSDNEAVKILRQAITDWAATGVLDMAKLLEAFEILKTQLSAGINIPINIDTGDEEGGKPNGEGGGDRGGYLTPEEAREAGVPYRPKSDFDWSDSIYRAIRDEDISEANRQREEPTYHRGGIVDFAKWTRAHRGLLAMDELPIIAQRGEGIVSRKGMQAFDRLNQGYSGGDGYTKAMYDELCAMRAELAAMRREFPRNVGTSVKDGMALAGRRRTG